MKHKNDLTILGVETSCDETAVSLLKIENCKLKIVSNVVSSQVKIHAKYGGIVPEVAARKHAENIVPVLETALANLHKSTTNNTNKKFVRIRGQIRDYLRSIDAIAVTNGPGLITSLLIGVEAAKTLAFLAKKPLIPVNHLAGHIYANWLLPISASSKSQIPNPKSPPGRDPAGAGQNPNSKFEIPNSSLFPAVCLIVSGGHTELVLMRDFEKFKKIGQTLDDAAGECFDKTAKILGLGYPGGPAIASIANQHKLPTNITNKNNSRKFVSKLVNIRDIKLPRPMINSGDFNFSFSGLKTAVLYKVKDFPPQADQPRAERYKVKDLLPEFCYEIQQSIIDVLINKTIRAAKKFSAKSIILGGGVVANDELRKQFESKVYSLLSGVKFFAPAKNLCTDNAAMVAAAGYFKLKKTPRKDWLKKFDWRKIKVNPNLEV